MSAPRPKPTPVRSAGSADVPACGDAWGAQRSSLEYQHAFDFCAVQLQRVRGPVAVFTSSPFYARELLKRLDGVEAALVRVGSWPPPTQNTGEWQGPELQSPAVSSLEAIQPGLEAAVWAEPELDRGQHLLRHIGQLLRADAKLYVVVSNWLAAVLPEWQEEGCRPAKRPAGLRRMRTWLRGEGFALVELVGFHGPRSILWGYASRWMERLGRGDWADRCHFKMRAEYVVSGWQAICTPVSVAVSGRR